MLTTIENRLVDRRMQTWTAQLQKAVHAPEDRERPDRWRRRALAHLRTWLQAVVLAWLVGFAIVLLGIPVAVIGRGVIELVSWIAGALR